MKTAAVLFAALIAAGSAWSVARADDGNGRHHGHAHQQHWQNGQCYSGQYNGRQHRRGDNDNDNDNDGNNGRYNNNNNTNNNGRYGNGQYGRSGNCGQYGGQYGNGQYGNGQYGNGQYGNGQYGNGQYGNGQYGQRGNATLSGEIVAVNGNQVQIQQQNRGSRITINDQPALDRQTSGRVSVGRYVTAYGYWQNGVFYATQMD